MKIKSLLALIILSGNLSYSQNTEKYDFFLNQLSLINKETITNRFRNGNIKNVYTEITYTHKDSEYSTYSGELIIYKKNGKKLEEKILDKAGTALITKSYWNGKLWIKRKAIELDTNANNLEDFFYGRAISIISEEEVYSFNKEKNKLTLYEKGIRVNNKKSGTWIIYKNGKIKKKKTYKNVDKFKKPVKITYLKL